MSPKVAILRVGLFLISTVVGCAPTARLDWSPDGSLGVYSIQNGKEDDPIHSVLIDRAGKRLGEMEPTAVTMLPPPFPNAGACWTSDSKSYFFVRPDKTAGSMELRTKWAPDPAPPVPPSKPGEHHKVPPFAELCRWSDGKVERLTGLERGIATDIQVAPANGWVAVVLMNEDVAGAAGGGALELFVYRPGSRKLFLVSRACGCTCCFTGPDRLVYVQQDPIDAPFAPVGEVTELDLSETADVIAPRPLAKVLVESTTALFATKTGVSIVAAAVAFPAPIGPDHSADTAMFHWTRESNSITQVLPHCLVPRPSPDGTRILYVLGITGDGGEGRATVGIANVDGSNSHTFDLPGVTAAMLPTWHGNDTVTLAVGPGTPTASDAQRYLYSVVDFRMTPGNKLEPVNTISGSWDESLKPFQIQKSRPVAAKP